MLSAWRKSVEDHTTRDRVWAGIAAGIVAAVAVALGALVAVVVIDGEDVDWNWAVIADVMGGPTLGIAALIGAIGGLRTLRQRTRADERAEWWKRAEKASDYLVSGNPDSVDVGVKLLDALIEDDRRTGQREWAYVYAIATAVTLDENTKERDNDRDEGGSDD